MKYIKNLVLFYLSYVFNFIIGFALIKILSTTLNQEALGRYFYITNIGALAGNVLLLGFPLTFQRYIPLYQREGKMENAYTLVHIPVLAHTLIGIILSIPILILFGYAYFSLFFSFYLINTITLYQTALVSTFKVLEYSLTVLFRGILLISSFLIVRPLINLERIGTISLLVNLLFLLILFTQFPLKLTSAKKVLNEIKDYWKYSLFNQLLAPFFVYLDSLLIPLFLPFSQLSLFQISRKLDFGTRQTLELPLQLTAPIISFKKTDELVTVEFAEKYRAFRLFYFYLTFFWFLIFQFLGKFLIILISNKNYLPAYPYLLGISFSFLITTLYATDSMLARSLGNIKLFFYKDVLWLLGFIIIFFLTAPKLGLRGVLIAFLLSSIITSLYHILNFKVLSSFEYGFESLRLVFIGIQSALYLYQNNSLPSLLILTMIIALDFNNFKKAINILVSKLREK